MVGIDIICQCNDNVAHDNENQGDSDKVSHSDKSEENFYLKFELVFDSPLL